MGQLPVLATRLDAAVDGNIEWCARVTISRHRIGTGLKQLSATLRIQDHSRDMQRRIRIAVNRVHLRPMGNEQRDPLVITVTSSHMQHGDIVPPDIGLGRIEPKQFPDQVVGDTLLICYTPQRQDAVCQNATLPRTLQLSSDGGRVSYELRK